MAKSKYDWKKTAWKFGRFAVFVIISGIAAEYGDSNWYLMIAPLLEAGRNYIKNKNI